MGTSVEPSERGFSSQQREALLLLKRQPGASLAEVASGLGISKVAALRHLGTLEGSKLVQRSYRTQGVGRPTVHFELTAEARKVFPAAYAEMSTYALGFIEERLGREAVLELLRQRSQEVAALNRPRLQSKELAARAAELTQIRDEGGYMAELSRRRAGCLEMREHNCPILAIADRFPEACEVERRMFESMLNARVETTHRVVAGDPVCRFLIRPGPNAP